MAVSNPSRHEQASSEAGGPSQRAALIGRLTSLCQVASILAVFGGWLILAAWIMGLALPTGWSSQDVSPGYTALAFVLAGLALALLSCKFERSEEARSLMAVIERRIGFGCACVVTLIGLLALGEHVFGWNLQVEALLLQTSSATRLGPNVALTFVLVGCSLLFLTVKTRPAQWMAVVAGCVALLSLLLAAYGQRGRFSFEAVLHIALAAALVFLVLCAGFMWSRSGGGLTEILSKRTPGSLVVRRLLPAAVAVPIVLGTLIIEGRGSGYLDVELGLAIFVVANVVVFSGLLTWTARTCDRLDEERARTEDALRQAERKYRAIFQNAVDGIFQMTTEGRFILVNPAMAQMLGYESPDELLKDNPAASQRLFAQGSRRAEFVRLAEDKGAVKSFEFAAVRKDGATIWLMANARLVADGDGQPPFYEGMMADITTRKKLEEQFLQAQKMEAVGRLAGGVAHDFNNILGVILGYAELAMDDRGVRERTRGLLGDIKKSTERAVTLTRQLLAFSRKQSQTMRLLDLNLLVTDFKKMMLRIIGEDIHFVTLLRPGVSRVKADPGQLEQVMLNLAVNARDAMPAGGTFAIESANVRLEADAAHLAAGIAPGHYAMLTFRDTGCGMTPEVRNRIFEPFFTTKEPGKGTGLGLATVYNVVKQSGGHIEVQSAPGEGTTFTIYLPRVEAGEETALKRELPPDNLPRGWETVLLVEDEEGVRAMTRAMLTSLGYQVIEARDAHEAIRICESRKDPVHLLLTDVVMPELRGPDLADRLLAQWPGLKVLFMSGYAPDTLVSAGHPAVAPLIAKPFTRVALGHALRDLLDEPAAEHVIKLDASSPLFAGQPRSRTAAEPALAGSLVAARGATRLQPREEKN